MFDMRNVSPSFSDELIRVVDSLNGKAVAGEFELNDYVSYWVDNEVIVEPMGLGHDGGGYYFAKDLAYLANINDGNIVFSENNNAWR